MRRIPNCEDGIWEWLCQITTGGISTLRYPPRSFALLVKPSNDSQTPPAEDNLLLTAHFEFANDDDIDEFGAGSSRMLHDEELSKMSTLVLDHPAMTREGVGAALSAAGAKVGPGHDKELRVLADATFGRLAFVTEILKVIAVNWLQLDGMWWSVDLQARQGSTVRRYSALFEPFEGKLVALKRGSRAHLRRFPAVMHQETARRFSR